jgi:tetratricopeptide (TPR) repeat protein
MLRNDKKFETDLERFSAFCNSKEGEANINNSVQGFVYLYLAKINKHFLQGSFSEGLKLVPEIEEKLQTYELQLDKHRTLVFYYKIACMYFGYGDYAKAVEYLNKIIHWKADLRTDIQCYARLLHLISHYELGNDMIIESQVKSVYRFMSNMKNLSSVETSIFAFLRKVFSLSRKEMNEHLQLLFDELKLLENNPLEARSFLYLDILSWLESKLKGVPVQAIITEKFRGRNS